MNYENLNSLMKLVVVFILAMGLIPIVSKKIFKEKSLFLKEDIYFKFATYIFKILFYIIIVCLIYFQNKPNEKVDIVDAAVVVISLLEAMSNIIDLVEAIIEYKKLIKEEINKNGEVTKSHFKYKCLYNDTLNFFDDFISMDNKVSLIKEMLQYLESIKNENIYNLEKQLKDEILCVEKNKMSDVISLAGTLFAILTGFYISSMSGNRQYINFLERLFTPLNCFIITTILLFFLIYHFKSFSQKSNKFLRYCYFYYSVLEDYQKYGKSVCNNKYNKIEKDDK